MQIEHDYPHARKSGTGAILAEKNDGTGPQ
jgi:hypothetical protein